MASFEGSGEAHAAGRPQAAQFQPGPTPPAGEEDGEWFVTRDAGLGDEEGGPGGVDPRPSYKSGTRPAVSQDFATLAQAQFDVLSSVLDVSQGALFFRVENAQSGIVVCTARGAGACPGNRGCCPGTPTDPEFNIFRAAGALEFVPVVVYPEKPSRVWITDVDGVAKVREGPRELPWSAKAANLLPQYPFISVKRVAGNMETSEAVENDDGGLSAPLVYGSVVLGMVTVWRKPNKAEQEENLPQQELLPQEEGFRLGGEAAAAAAAVAAAASAAGQQAQEPLGRAAAPDWTAKDKDTLEKVASTLAVASVLDQRQRWAAAVQVEHLRRVLAETLHQVKNPLTALRTFGKLLLRRLPPDDSLNRELARDIILQSDRLVDLILPVDSVIGALAAASTGGDSAVASPLPALQLEGLAAAAAYAATDDGDGGGGGGSGDGSGELNPNWSSSHAPPQALRGTATLRRGEVPSEGEVVVAYGGNGETAPATSPVLASSTPVAALTGGEAVAAAAPAAAAAGEEFLAEGEAGPFLSLLFVQDVVEPVVRAAHAVAQSRHVAFRWFVQDGEQDLPGVMGHERCLQEALSNVIDNAFKYVAMYPGSRGERLPTVELRMRTSSESDWGASRGVVLEVIDTGPGVSAEDLPRAFERGYRGKAPLASGIPGTGLGLGIARDIMRSMGGDLRLVNSPSTSWGAVSLLFLPRRRPAGAAGGGPGPGLQPPAAGPDGATPAAGEGC